jgi:hypothetical protein
MADERPIDQELQEPQEPQAAAAPAPPPEPEPSVEDQQDQAREKLLQDTRAWLQRVGGVGTPEAPTVAYPRAPTPAYRQPAPPEPTQDVEQLRQLLHEGNDTRFIESLLTTAEQRAARRVSFDQNVQQRNYNFGQEVNKFVAIHAPDLPPVVFWAFADEAERRYPGQVDMQIDFAINMGRQAMQSHTAQQGQRAGANRANLDRSDTLDNGSPTRRRRGGETEREESFVETLTNFRNKFS